MKQLMITFLVFTTLSKVGCNEPAEKKANNYEVKSIFPKGEAGPAANFTGKAWNHGLVAIDSLYNTVIGNVILSRVHEVTGIYTQPARS